MYVLGGESPPVKHMAHTQAQAFADHARAVTSSEQPYFMLVVCISLGHVQQRLGPSTANNMQQKWQVLLTGPCGGDGLGDGLQHLSVGACSKSKRVSYPGLLGCVQCGLLGCWPAPKRLVYTVPLRSNALWRRAASSTYSVDGAVKMPQISPAGIETTLISCRPA